MSDKVQKEAEKSAIDKSGPKEGELIHHMKWVQDSKKIFLQGMGWNFSRNLRTDARFTKLKIILAEFEDNTQLIDFCN